ACDEPQRDQDVVADAHHFVAAADDQLVVADVHGQGSMLGHTPPTSIPSSYTARSVLLGHAPCLGALEAEARPALGRHREEPVHTGNRIEPWMIDHLSVAVSQPRHRDPGASRAHPSPTLSRG